MQRSGPGRHNKPQIKLAALRPYLALTEGHHRKTRENRTHICPRCTWDSIGPPRTRILICGYVIALFAFTCGLALIVSGAVLELYDLLVLGGLLVAGGIGFVVLFVVQQKPHRGCSTVDCVADTTPEPTIPTHKPVVVKEKQLTRKPSDFFQEMAGGQSDTSGNTVGFTQSFRSFDQHINMKNESVPGTIIEVGEPSTIMRKQCKIPDLEAIDKHTTDRYFPAVAEGCFPAVTEVHSLKNTEGYSGTETELPAILVSSGDHKTNGRPHELDYLPKKQTARENNVDITDTITADTGFTGNSNMESGFTEGTTTHVAAKRKKNKRREMNDQETKNFNNDLSSTEWSSRDSENSQQHSAQNADTSEA